MLYHYVAVNAEGKMLDADFDADTMNDVLRHLSSENLRPVSVKPVKQKGIGMDRFFGGRINTSDKVFLTKYLALMLRVGTDLLSAINILLVDFDKPAVRNLLLEVRDNLTKGKPFYEAFAKHPRTFSPTFVNLVKAAETAGNLQKTFEDLSNTLEKDSELQGRIRAALIYPIILLVMAAGIMIFLFTFALPKIANVFDTSGINPPAFSKFVFTVGLFIGGNIFIILPVLFALIGGITWAVYKTDVGRRVFSNVITSLPLIKTIYQQIAIQRMASTMSALMKAGLPITETITVAADTMSVREYRFALLRIANDGLEKGLTIGEAFRRESVIPKSVSNLIAISEKAGHLEEVLATLAEFYGANVDSSIKGLVSLLEPAMLLIMGVLVAFIALSIIVPVYQLTTQF